MRRSKRRREVTGLRPARKQREVIRDVMLSAGQCATWLTLDELTKLTQYPPASISAQLRHLRKPRYGGYAVVKRCRMVNKAMRAEGFGALWEYSVEPVRRVIVQRKRKRRQAPSGSEERSAPRKNERPRRAAAPHDNSDRRDAWA
jgi:hypothetical protein